LAGLASLPPLQREALLRTALGGESHEQVAQALGVSDDAVRGMIHRARVALRAAATALTPPPLAAWAASARGGSLTQRLAEVIGAGSAGATGAMVKTGVIALTAGGLVTGSVLVPAGHSGHRALGGSSTKAHASSGAPASFEGESSSGPFGRGILVPGDVGPPSLTLGSDAPGRRSGPAVRELPSLRGPGARRFPSGGRSPEAGGNVEGASGGPPLTFTGTPSDGHGRPGADHGASSNGGGDGHSGAGDGHGSSGAPESSGGRDSSGGGSSGESGSSPGGSGGNGSSAEGSSPSGSPSPGSATGSDSHGGSDGGGGGVPPSSGPGTGAPVQPPAVSGDSGPAASPSPAPPSGSSGSPRTAGSPGADS
jgi:hypothetical protein